ncbi:MAG: hypothetical protein ACREU9_00230 [Gammaproteobacteria bacterium]
MAQVVVADPETEIAAVPGSIDEERSSHFFREQKPSLTRFAETSLPQLIFQFTLLHR